MPERRDAERLLRWSEVEALQRGGIVEVQSHSMLHRRVFVSSRLIGFVPPTWSGPRFNAPKAPADRRPWTLETLKAEAGAPLFEHRPLLSVRRAWVGGVGLRGVCLDRVGREDPESFFRRGDWQRQLRRLAGQSRCDDRAWAELDEERRWEITESKRMLEDRLIRPALHFCCPSGAGDADTIALTRKAGYVSCAWGLLDHRLTNRRGANPHLLARIKHDFIVTLPGEGRRSLLELLKTKLARRLRGEKGY